jgi:hypothetical protein
LLAQAESHFESVVSYEGDDAQEIPAFEPVAIPNEVATPGTVEPPVPQPKRPHSLAVIMARGADF